VLSSDLLIRVKLDDAVDAIPVHGVNGMWGLIAVGLFSEPERMRQAYGTGDYPGFFYSLGGGNGVSANLLGCQGLGILFIFGWSLSIMLPFFLWLNFMGWLRSESVQELVGLDITYGGVAAAQGVLLGDDGDGGLQEEYLDAYEKYRQSMQQKRGSVSASMKPKAISQDEDEE
jgi:ammonia channel protein AmtB